MFSEDSSRMESMLEAAGFTPGEEWRCGGVPLLIEATSDNAHEASSAVSSRTSLAALWAISPGATQRSWPQGHSMNLGYIPSDP